MAYFSDFGKTLIRKHAMYGEITNGRKCLLHSSLELLAFLFTINVQKLYNLEKCTLPGMSVRSGGIFISVDIKKKPMALENKVTRNLLEIKLGSIRTLKKILNVELHFLCFSQNIIKTIKSRRLG